VGAALLVRLASGGKHLAVQSVDAGRFPREPSPKARLSPRFFMVPNLFWQNGTASRLISINLVENIGLHLRRPGSPGSASTAAASRSLELTKSWIMFF